MVVDLGPLQKFLLLDQVEEFRFADERVALAVDFARPGWPRGVRDRVFEPGIELEQAPENGILPYSARPGDYDQEPAVRLARLGVDQRIVRAVSEFHASSKSSGGGAAQVSTAPVRGWRNVRLSAWSAGRVISAERRP